MRCRTARQLIALEPDRQLDARRQRSLQEHLCACESCRAFRSRMALVVPALTADPRESSHELSPGFYAALQDALVAVDAERGSRLVTAAERPLLRALSRWPQPLRTASYALVAAVVLVACLLSATTLSTPSCSVAPDFNANHLASLSLRGAPDGRVYASLATRSAPARAVGRECVP